MKASVIALLTKLLFVVSVLTMPAAVFAQARCFSDEEAKKAIGLINAPQNVSTPNEALRLELLKLQAERQDLDEKIFNDWEKNQKLVPSVNQMSEKHLLRLCEIIKQHGWVGKETIGEDGVAAALFLLRSNQALELQKEIFPVVVAAAKKGYVGNNHVAWLFDSIRVGSGQPQVFGTQTRVRDDFFYLYPLQNEAKVDEWRKLYNLPPLADFIKYLQGRYQTVVFKSPRPPVAAQSKENKPETPAAAGNAVADPLLNLESEEVVKVESNLVNINVRVNAADATTPGAPVLQKNDFVVFEDGKQQEIEFFSTAEAPFDLVLLLDLSGSTAGKQDLIRKSTRRFIEASRPADRIAIVTFTNEAKIVANLTDDREELLKSIKKINDRGGSGVWGALQFVYEKIIKPQSQGRRSAVLFMTDGVDSSLISPMTLRPDYPTFDAVLETVRSNDTAVIPIYLDVEAESDPGDKRAYRTARQTLKMLADETGSQMFYAKKVEDLSGVYEKIINDLGKVYSLGYQSTNENRDGAWRKLTVNIKNQPNLTVRTKQGYYAK